MYNEKELEKEYKEMYKVLKYNFEHGTKMVCPKCGQSRIDKVAWEGDHLRRMACIICWGYYDIDLKKRMLPCCNCKYNNLIQEFFKDKKEDWVFSGKSVKDWLIHYQICVDCYTLRNHDRFFHYEPKDEDRNCDSCKERSQNGQLYIIDNFYNDRGGKLATCYHCREEKFTFVNKKEYETLKKKVEKIEIKINKLKESKYNDEDYLTLKKRIDEIEEKINNIIQLPEQKCVISRWNKKTM